MQRILELRQKIFNQKLNLKSNFNDLVNYYPPGISVFKLAQQDESLRKLGLRDEWLDKRLNREIMLQQRNKNIRVSGYFANSCVGAAKTSRKANRQEEEEKVIIYLLVATAFLFPLLVHLISLKSSFWLGTNPFRLNGH